MHIKSIYDDAFDYMENIVQQLTQRKPKPLFVEMHGYRYTEQDAFHAILQKLARIVSTLRAAHLLLSNGFIQEQASLCRIVDEAEVDVTFLALGLIHGETDLHKRFLSTFYQEENEDPDRPAQTRNKRGNVPRQKIAAFIANSPTLGGDPSTAIAAMQAIHKTTSGYIHGASPFLMEMYCGRTCQFRMNGLRTSRLWQDHKDDIWNYVYRGLVAFCLTAKAIGDNSNFDTILEYTRKFSLSEPK